MTSDTATPASHSVRAPSKRIAYLDAARALAIIGMFLAHITVFVTLPAPLEFLVSGRSAIMFAVLAGVSTTLIARSHAATEHERLGYVNASSARELLIRSIILFLIGITLPLISVGPIVILSTYAVLFLLAIPLLRLSTRVIAILTALTVVITPVLSFWLRTMWPDTSEEVVIGGVPTIFSFTSAQDAVQAVCQLLFDGMYPVLTWIPFLLAGIIIGRLFLNSTFTTRLAAIWGTVLVFVGYGASFLLVNISDFLSQRISVFREMDPSLAEATDAQLMEQFGKIAYSDFGVTSINDPRSLLFASSHSGSITEIIGGIGFVLLVLAVLSLVERFAGPLLAPFSTLGKMPLTYYVGHIIGFMALAIFGSGQISIWLALVYFVVLPMVFAAMWFHIFRRGPLEAMMHAVTQQRTRNREKE